MRIGMRGLWTLAMALIAVAVVAVAALSLAQMYGRPAAKDYSYDYYLLKRAAAAAPKVQVEIPSLGQCPEPGVNQTVVYVYQGRAVGFAADWRRGDLRYYFYLCTAYRRPAITAKGERAHLYLSYVKHGLDPLPALIVTDELGRDVSHSLVAELNRDGSLAVPVLVAVVPQGVGFCVYDYPFGGCIWSDNTQTDQIFPPVS